jgi:pyridoxal phosphate enzyme (YggS family)
MMVEDDGLAARWRAVRERVAAACADAGRHADDVRILPVTKTFGVDVVREAVALGLTRFGENKVQEIRQKHGPLADCGIDWVMIGHLQTNKAKDVARLASEVQSLDRPELAHALERRLQHEGRAIDVLVQVKTSREPSKYGLEPQALRPFLRELRACPALRVRGLMTLAILSKDADEVRACFRNLRELRDRAQDEGFELPRLSMGMSGDFDIAIAEGATEVRIGTAIFGRRPYADSYYWPESPGSETQS